MQVHEIQLFYRNARKAFCFLVMLVLLMVCNGCFTWTAESICDRCHDDIQIIERHGELSNDGESLSIHLKMRRDYCRDPFGIWKGSIVEEENHVYPLTRPESVANHKQFSVVLDTNAERISFQHLEVTDEKEAEHRDFFEADYNRLIFPVFNQVKPVLERVVAQDECTICIHPDDLPFISRPFVYNYWYYSPPKYRLVIPYKLEGNVCYVYLPKKGLITPSKVRNKPNTSAYILEIFLKTPAVLLDVVTFPIQFIPFCYAG